MVRFFATMLSSCWLLRLFLAAQQYWARPEPYQFIPVKNFSAAFAATPLGQRNLEEANSLQEVVAKDKDVDPLVRDK